jgi:prepilin-type N-terminal cleavage/methylation domain-containing protein
MRHTRESDAGFTLVEILVVIVIIGILAAITLVGVNAALRAAKNSQAEAMVKTIGGQCESYRVRWGDYPPTWMGDWKATLPNDINNGSESLVACLASTLKGEPLCDRDEQLFCNVDGDATQTNLTRWFFGDMQLREFADPWGRPVLYLHSKDFKRTTGAPFKYRMSEALEEVTIKPAMSSGTKTFANVGKYQIWSAGVDGIPGNADDVVGW